MNGEKRRPIAPLCPYPLLLLPIETRPIASEGDGRGIPAHPPPTSKAKSGRHGHLAPGKRTHRMARSKPFPHGIRPGSCQIGAG
jgi:hypothetical protein